MSRTRNSVHLQVTAGERRKRASETRSRMVLLTPREQQVLRHVVEGHASKQIAAMLRMSVRTVEVHRARIMRKMGAQNPIALACNVQCANCEFVNRAAG